MTSAPSLPDDATATLDLRGLKCPMPVLRTRKALNRMAPGARLVVLCTDPMAVIDIPNLAREQGDLVESQERVGEVIRFRLLRRRAD